MLSMTHQCLATFAVAAFALSAPPVRAQSGNGALHDTYYVVAHYHYLITLAVITGVLMILVRVARRSAFPPNDKALRIGWILVALGILSAVLQPFTSAAVLRSLSHPDGVPGGLQLALILQGLGSMMLTAGWVLVAVLCGISLIRAWR